MLAVVIAEPNRFELRDIPRPEPGRGQTLLKVMSTTICATDQKILAGQFAGVKYLHTPGHHFAGELVARRRRVFHAGEADAQGLEGDAAAAWRDCTSCARTTAGRTKATRTSASPFPAGWRNTRPCR